MVLAPVAAPVATATWKVIEVGLVTLIELGTKLTPVPLKVTLVVPAAKWVLVPVTVTTVSAAPALAEVGFIAIVGIIVPARLTVNVAVGVSAPVATVTVLAPTAAPPATSARKVKAVGLVTLIDPPTKVTPAPLKETVVLPATKWVLVPDIVIATFVHP